MSKPRWWTFENEEEFRKAFRKGTPRFLRAKRFADNLVSALEDFLPRDTECVESVHDYLVRMSFSTNACIINVPEEWDALNKMQIEAAMLQARFDDLTILTKPKEPKG